MSAALRTSGRGKKWRASDDRFHTERELTMSSNSSQSDVIAVERHRAGAWIAIILLAVAGPAMSVALTHSAPAGFALVLVSVIGFGVLTFAWSGFEYRFLRDGVEVRMLGLRLRSMP